MSLSARLRRISDSDLRWLYDLSRDGLKLAIWILGRRRRREVNMSLTEGSRTNTDIVLEEDGRRIIDPHGADCLGGDMYEIEFHKGVNTIRDLKGRAITKFAGSWAGPRQPVSDFSSYDNKSPIIPPYLLSASDFEGTQLRAWLSSRRKNQASN